MEEFFDLGDDWRERAWTDTEAVAEFLLRLRRSRWLPPPPADPLPSTPVREVPPQVWGLRGKRSRTRTMRGVKEETKRELLRASPMTPLDYGHGSSESGADEVPEVAVTGSSLAGCAETKEVVEVGRSPLIFRIPDPKPIRRSTKKKTITELQAMQTTLLEERLPLLMEVEARRRYRAALEAKNRELKGLKLSLESQKRMRTEDSLREEEVLQRKQARYREPLPDLNIPLNFE